MQLNYIVKFMSHTTRNFKRNSKPRYLYWMFSLRNEHLSYYLKTYQKSSKNFYLIDDCLFTMLMVKDAAVEHGR